MQLFSDSVRKEILLGNSKTADFKQVVEQLGLSQLLDRHPISLSGGEQQRVIIANALLSNKKIIIFDEPTSGLDYEQMLSFSKLLQELKSPERVIIVITHDLELINEACQQIRFIRKVP
ncbi:ATP-binding cassette domain-containing protein [Streptococcus orisratti]|uniref:ATP-binding cassette domain-containing protein n=1 Tax=Streptococcus orisratti TaxID=114652 RepID=UPI003D01D461